MNELCNCPNCGVDLNDGSIWEYFFKKTGSEQEADRLAKNYGATRENNRQFRRQIGIYDAELDCTVAWECPDCGHQWDRRGDS